MRGKRCLSLCLPVPGGSIPACAGETLDLLLIFCLCWVYPRLCGGNCCSVALPLCWPGLSPLVRGKQFLIVNRQFLIGSIPACAGETPLHRQGSRWRRVYPRLCGGNGNTMTQTYTQEGLSPLVRGKPIPPFVPGSARRSIPACAGETSSPAPTPRATRVYPRLCGGNYIVPLPPLFCPGLSPLVRGKHGGDTPGVGSDGSIPACAGETLVFNIMIC